MTRRLLLIIFFGANALTIAAQNSLSDSDDSIRQEATSNAIKGRLSTPFGAAALSNFVSGIHVSSFFEAGVNGNIELHKQFKAGWTSGLSLDQQIGSTDKKALPLSLTGVSPGTTIQFNLQKMFWHPGFDKLSDEQIRQLNDVEKTYAKRNNIADARTIGLREIRNNGTEAEKEMALDAFNTSFREPFFINAKVGFTKTAFTYSKDSIDLTPITDAYVTPTFTLSLVKVLGSGFNVLGYFALSYNYSVTYLAADALTFNIPFGSTRNYFSRNLSPGKPAKQTDNTISAEFRKNIFFKNANKSASNIAISPSVNYCIDSKLAGIFLPVYFIRGADANGKLLDGLQGGMRFGYITNTLSGNFASFNKGFIAQLIISAPLDFLGVL
jgi:hypothetical protein